MSLTMINKKFKNININIKDSIDQNASGAQSDLKLNRYNENKIMSRVLFRFSLFRRQVGTYSFVARIDVKWFTST